VLTQKITDISMIEYLLLSNKVSEDV